MVALVLLGRVKILVSSIIQHSITRFQLLLASIQSLRHNDSCLDAIYFLNIGCQQLYLARYRMDKTKFIVFLIAN